MKSNFMRIPLETEQTHQVFLNLGEVFWVLSSIHYTSKFCGQSAIQRQASSTTRRVKACTPSASESWAINGGKARNPVLFDLAPHHPEISRRLLNVGPTVRWWAKNMLWSLLSLFDFSWQAWDKLGSLFQPVNDKYLHCHVPVRDFFVGDSWGEEPWNCAKARQHLLSKHLFCALLRQSCKAGESQLEHLYTFIDNFVIFLCIIIHDHTYDDIHVLGAYTKLIRAWYMLEKSWKDMRLLAVGQLKRFKAARSGFVRYMI